MDFDRLEKRLGIGLPEAHRRALVNRLDRIHGVCDFLVPHSPYPLLDILTRNEQLHAADRPGGAWPAFLVAIASNGCGDFFAYDARTAPARVVYMDPSSTVEENLIAQDQLTFADFGAWYAWMIGRRA